MNCLTFRQRGCGPASDPWKQARANMEVTMHENIRSTKRDIWIARIWQIPAIWTKLSAQVLSNIWSVASWHSNKKCGAPVIHLTETKIRRVQDNEVRTCSGAARIYL